MTRNWHVSFYHRLGLMAVAVALAASALPVQAEQDHRREGDGRQVEHGNYRGGHDEDRGGHGDRGDYRDGGGDLGAVVVGALLGAVAAGALQAPPAVIYTQPAPPPPPGVRYYPSGYYPPPGY